MSIALRGSILFGYRVVHFDPVTMDYKMSEMVYQIKGTIKVIDSLALSLQIDICIGNFAWFCALKLRACHAAITLVFWGLHTARRRIHCRFEMLSSWYCQLVLNVCHRHDLKLPAIPH